MSIREDCWYFPPEFAFNRNDCISSIPEVENLREEWRKILEKADFSVKDSLEEDEEEISTAGKADKNLTEMLCAVNVDLSDAAPAAALGNFFVA